MAQHRCMICGRKARPKKNTCINCSGKVNLLKEDKVAVPRVVHAPHFETIGPDSIWPKGRLFFRAEFQEGIEEGTWPAGMRVRDEKGKKYEVCLQLKRLK